MGLLRGRVWWPLAVIPSLSLFLDQPADTDLPVPGRVFAAREQSCGVFSARFPPPAVSLRRSLANGSAPPQFLVLQETCVALGAQLGNLATAKNAQAQASFFSAVSLPL